MKKRSNKIWKSFVDGEESFEFQLIFTISWAPEESLSSSKENHTSVIGPNVPKNGVAIVAPAPAPGRRSALSAMPSPYKGTQVFQLVLFNVNRLLKIMIIVLLVWELESFYAAILVLVFFTFPALPKDMF